MIGLGKWKARVDHMFFKGDVILEIKDNNGEYDFDIDLNADMELPDFRFYDIVEDGNTLKGKGEVSLLPGKEIEAFLEFDGDKMSGYLKAPLVGKIKIKDGVKVG
ncbi:MAG: hypothetical protein GXY95_05085 [Clostridiales bacterium]|nr:hypothetical protein [Clostridiales bacterium]HOA34164.1 hypothetical protein [Clostridiales bacterium]HOJ36486.1 hypothetical protein [Clostridiales bacterium]HOL78997.1 hypothetical protein [Clostridiales bacterium]HPP67601.1 hypothetical protein [Clostridiales bacterium]